MKTYKDIGGPCEVEGCTNRSTQIVYRAATATLMLACEQHAYDLIDERDPEYHVTCPNCGCDFGVN